MPAVVLYLAATIALVAVWRRFVQPVSAMAAIVLILLPFCFTGRALLAGRIYAPVDLPFMAEPLKDYGPESGVIRMHNSTLSDLYSQIIPWQRAVRHAFTHGEWPVWNPFLLCGSILAANMQAAPYDWVQLLGLLLPHAQALTFAAAMAFFCAGFFTFAFARAHGVGEVASLIAAAGYTFHAFLAFFIGWPLGRAWTYFPFVLFAVRAIAREPRLRNTVLLTIALTITIFAGHPESVLHIVTVGIAYGLFELTRATAPRAIAFSTIAGVLALGLTAISLMPFLSAAPETSEYHFRRDRYATTDFFTTPANVAVRAARAFFPFVGGQPERGNPTPLWDPNAPRTGSVIVALACCALLLARRRETWFFVGLAFFGLCAAFDGWPVAHLLHALPLFDIALNQRLGFAGAFALAMLAAFAIDAMWRTGNPACPEVPRNRDRQECLSSTIVVVLVTIVLAVFTYVLWPHMLSAGVDEELMQSLTFVELVPLAILALLFALRVQPRIALPLVLALVLVQRTLEDGQIYPTLPRSAFYPEVPVLKAIPKTADPFRITGVNYSLLPDTAALYGLEDVRGYEAMTFARLTDTFPFWSHPQPISFNVVTELWRPFLSFLNVRYAIAHRDVPVPEGWKLLLEDRESRLLENTRALPRAFVPRRVRYEQNGKDVIAAMEKAADFADLAFITVEQYPPHEIANGPGSLSFWRTGFSYEIVATMELDGWVVISDSKWPGWRAYLDGSRVETHYANHAFIGVFVPKGKHHLKLAYVPEAFTRGKNVTFFTLVAIAAFFVLRHRLKKPRAVTV